MLRPRYVVTRGRPQQVQTAARQLLVARCASVSPVLAVISLLHMSEITLARRFAPT